MTLRLCIAGAGGRMGQTLVEAALADPEVALASALEVAGSPVVGRDAGERFGRTTGVAISADIPGAVGSADVLVDFTRPAGTLAHLAACARSGVAAVVGTTGLSAEDKRVLSEHGRSIPIVFAANMSVGVTVLARLAEQAAKLLGEGYDVEIVEMHHRHKVDAPSGTALLLGEAAARGLGRDLENDAVVGRRGVTGERKRGAIGFASLRGGDVVGDHTVVFAGSGERLELVHRAGSRLNFAQGALRAAKFVASKRDAGTKGLFDMRDVLGLR
ncbi:MAG TPA: 4-hydroxy-tetrahydrodipicolinate reductase [Casimicrobiaceae bacterium]|nr:4-hydroxy-tetrahydrodipicolinate reductase [Casimicrobiaceae bacterium]